MSAAVGDQGEVTGLTAPIEATMPDDPQRSSAWWTGWRRLPASGRPVTSTPSLLGDARIPVPRRIAAAARVLRLLPDRDGPCAGCSRAPHGRAFPQSPPRTAASAAEPGRDVRRARRLYRRARAEVKLACPRCHVRLPRVEMVKHLWHEHGLMLDKGKTRTPEREIAKFQELHATTGDAEPLDRVAALAGIPGLRAWMATDDLPAWRLPRPCWERPATAAPACAPVASRNCPPLSSRFRTR